MEVNGHVFERVKSYKILGMWIDEDLKGKTNVEYLAKKTSKWLFTLKILRNYSAPMGDLKSFNTSLIISTLEYRAHIWHGNLTHEQTRDIERIQKRALRIILPGLSYEEALVECVLKTLKGRKEDVCINLFRHCSSLVLNCMICYHPKFVKLGIEKQDQVDKSFIILEIIQLYMQ